MKMRKSSRIISFALALVMILPLISVPTFAADAVAEPTYLYEQNFDGFADNHQLTAADGFGKDHVEGSIVIPDGTGSNKGKVWKVPSDSTNANQMDAHCLGFAQNLSYESSPVLAVDFEIYIPASHSTSNGRIQFQFITSPTGSFECFNINLATREIEKGSGTISMQQNLSLTADAWHKISYVLDMVNGSFTVYNDGAIALAGDHGVSNIVGRRATYAFALGKVESGKVGADGDYYLVDNIQVYPTTADKVVLFAENFDNATDSSSFATNAAGSVVADTTNSDKGKVWAFADLAKTNGASYWSSSMVGQLFQNTTTYPYVVYEFDLYLEEGAKGQIGLQTVIASAQNTDSTTNDWRGIFAIDATNNKLVGIYSDNGGLNTVNVVGRDDIEKETWYTISVVFDTVNGEYDLYINGYKALEVEIGACASFQLKQNTYFAFPRSVSASGTAYFDNISFYEGTAPRNAKEGTRPLDPYAQNFENLASIGSMYNGGTAPANDAIIDDPTDSDKGKVWSVNVGSHKNCNTGATLDIQKYFNHAAGQNLVYQLDFYVSADAVGRIGMDAFLYPNGDSSKTRVEHSIYALDFSMNEITLTEAGVSSTPVKSYNSASFERETWYTLAIAFDLKACTYTIYLDGYKVMDASMDTSNWTIYSSLLCFQKANQGVTLGGTVYYDNVEVYAATQPKVVNEGKRPIPFKSESQDYEADNATAPGTGSSIVTIDGNKVAQITNSAKNNAILGAQSNGYSFTGSPVVAFQADYYVDITHGAQEAIGLESQIHAISGTNAEGAAATQYWTYLFIIYRDAEEDAKYKEGYARLQIGGVNNQELYVHEGHNDRQMYIPCNEWVTITTVIDMVTGQMTVFANGIACGTANLGLTNVSFNSNEWYVAKFSSTDGQALCNVDNTSIFDGSDKTIVEIKEADVDENKTLQYIDVTIGDNAPIKTTSPKYLVAAGTEVTATVKYFNDDNKYDGIVSKPTDGTTSVRYGEPTGLRFKTTINEALVAELQAMVADGTLKAVEMGTLIAPEAWAADTAALKNLKAYTSEEYKALADDKKPAVGTYALKVAANKYYEENTIVGSIVNILETNLETKFAAAGYVKVTLLNGESVWLIAAELTVDSVKDVAQRVIDSGYNGAHMETLLGFGATPKAAE